MNGCGLSCLDWLKLFKTTKQAEEQLEVLGGDEVSAKN